MHRAVRAGGWPRTEGMQLTGKTIGLIGLGGIAAEVARIAGGGGMRVLAWNRTPRTTPGVTFVDLDTLLAESHVVSLHLLLNDETRGLPVGRAAGADAAGRDPGQHRARRAGGRGRDDRGAARAGGIGARGAGRVRRGAAAGRAIALTALENVTLSAHSAFRTPEASETLIRPGSGHRPAVAAALAAD